jgi:hypothetical protein
VRGPELGVPRPARRRPEHPGEVERFRAGRPGALVDVAADDGPRGEVALSHFVLALPNGSPSQFRARVWRPAVTRARLADPIRTAGHKAGQALRATVSNMVASTTEIGKFPTRPEAEAWPVTTAEECRLRAPAPIQAAPTRHALRHTAVAPWIAAGITDKFELRAYAGHPSIETIDRVYGHLLPRDASAARNALSAMRAAAREAREQAEATPSNVVALDGRRR